MKKIVTFIIMFSFLLVTSFNLLVYAEDKQTIDNDTKENTVNNEDKNINYEEKENDLEEKEDKEDKDSDQKDEEMTKKEEKEDNSNKKKNEDNNDNLENDADKKGIESLKNNSDDENKEGKMNDSKEQGDNDSKEQRDIEITDIENLDLNLTGDRSQLDGIYKIAVGRNPSLAIEVLRGDTYNNSTVDIWTYVGNNQQKFYFEYQSGGYYKITAMHTGKSLTVKNNQIVAGAEIVQSDYRDLNSQKWIFTNSNINGWMISPLSNPNLAITIQGSIVKGQKIVLASKQYTDNQMYYLYNISQNERTHTDAVYRINVGKAPNQALEVLRGDYSNNSTIDIWNYVGNLQQKFYIEYQAEGYYTITAMHSKRSLTVKDSNIKEGSEVVQYDYLGLPSQKWLLRNSNINGWVISPLSNPQLAISISGNIERGNKIVLSRRVDNDNQMFYIYPIIYDERTHKDGVYRISVSTSPSQTVEVLRGDKYNNSTVDIWNYAGNDQQKFYFEYLPEGCYKITAMHTGKSLTVKNSNIANGEEIVQYDFLGLPSQKWVIRNSYKNGFEICPLSNLDYALTVKDNITRGNKIILKYRMGNYNQIFNIEDISQAERTHSDGIYKIAVGCSPKQTIEVLRGDTANNSTVDIWTYVGNEQQKFYFEYQAEGFYKISAMHTGKCLTVKNGDMTEGSDIVQYDYLGLPSQKWILRNSNKNGWVICSLSNPELAISINGNIEKGQKLVLSQRKDNDNQMYYIYNIPDKEIVEWLYGNSGLMYYGNGGQYLKYYKIGKGPKHLFLTFAIHGFEDSYNFDGQELTYIADKVFDRLKKEFPDELVDKWTVYIFPSVNPDGEYNGYTNNGPGRTTLYSWASGHKGIDMNRCFPVDYKPINNNRNYNGNQPLQAYEAGALRDFILCYAGSENILIDVHGWLDETIGNYTIGNYYRNEFGISEHINAYGSGYLINWARSISNTRSMLLELPEINSHSQLEKWGYVDKFYNATINLLYNE